MHTPPRTSRDRFLVRCVLWKLSALAGCTRDPATPSLDAATLTDVRALDGAYDEAAALDARIADATTDAPSRDRPSVDAPSDAVTASADATPDGGLPGGWVLRWHDEFDGPDGAGVDPTRWAYETGGGGWGNGELENYTARTDNVVQRGGNLVITARRESLGGSSFTSGRIKTAGHFEFRYGRVEMRATLPQGQGIWPAFWMLGANIDAVSWPACGEVDIMEWVGRTPTRIFGTIHGPGYNGAGGIGAWHAEPSGYAAGFHTYAVEWEPDVLRWYFDDRMYELRTPIDLNGRAWVFDHDFFVLLNLAVGGAWPGAPDATTVFPQQYVVDYVRVYQRPTPPAPTARTIVTLRASRNGQFVSADSYDGDRLSANRGAASTWEFFETQDLGGGRVALRALQNDKFVSAGATGATLTADAETIGPGETFALGTNADGTRSLRCEANGRYVTVPASAPLHLAATATAVTSAESFTVAPHTP